MANKLKNPVSFDPREMTGGGLPTDFDGTIERARFTVWNYDKGEDFPYISIPVFYIRPDDGEDIPAEMLNEDGLIKYYCSSGGPKTMGLDTFRPSNDGEEPVDLESEDPADWEGLCVIAQGSRTKFPGGSNFSFFLGHALECGFQEFAGDLSAFDGVHGHFDRLVPERKGFKPGRRGDEGEGERERVSDVLVLTKIDSQAASKPAASKKAKSKSTKSTKAAPKAAAANGSAEIDEWLTELMVETLGDGPIHVDQVAKLIPKNWKGRPGDLEVKMAEAVKRIQEDGFLRGEDAPWTVDEEGGVELG